jgi:hypothetical protein
MSLPTQHSTMVNAFYSIPQMIPKNTILVEENGVDIYSCYSDESLKCRSIGFVCLAVLIEDYNYNINVGEGYFIENVIKIAVDGKSLNIEGSGVDSTFIIGNLYLNYSAQIDSTYTNNSHTSIFYSSGSNSLSVKKMSILISMGSRNLFKHESSGTFSVENIVIRPLYLFLQTDILLDVGLFFLNDAYISIKSVLVESLTTTNNPIFEFESSTVSSEFNFDNNTFYNIKRNINGGSVLAFMIPNSITISIKNCEVF